MTIMENKARQTDFLLRFTAVEAKDLPSLLPQGHNCVHITSVAAGLLSAPTASH